MSTEARGEEDLALVGGRGERGGNEREHENDELVRGAAWQGAQSLRPLAQNSAHSASDQLKAPPRYGGATAKGGGYELAY